MNSDNLIDCIDFEDVELKGGDVSSPVAQPCIPDERNVIKLEVGTEYETIEELQEMYTKYAKMNGFQIRRRNSRKNVVQFVCYREGTARPHKKRLIEDTLSSQKPHRFTKTSKIGCLACLYCWLDATSGKWRITKFLDEHNHKMVSPKSLKYLRTHKNLNASARCLSHAFSEQGISLSKVTDVLNNIPENAEFSQKDCYNYITKVRKHILESGDAQAVQNYCTRQQELNPDFRYAIQLDGDDRMLNFFWVDARSRSAYRIFGEVVSFDTTYRTNKYNMPFAPFVGIDNHMHTILFGCALLQDETERTFVWLFNAWVHAMDGKAPSAFVTDQDMAIMNAVKGVFPKARHRLCLWHIVKKFPERLAHIFHEKSKFKASINQCIHNTVTIEAFEEEWTRMIIQFQLEDNDWLRQLYSSRQLWVPVFIKDKFFGGMNTTGRSESINSFFDDFVHSGTTLREFVHKYSQAVDRRYDTFRRSEFDSRHKMPLFNLGMGLEEHAGVVYTPEIFKLFHLELSNILALNRTLIFDGDPLRIYKVSSRVNKGECVIVEYNPTNHEAKCECMSFEFRGILCRHILAIFYMHNIDEIPPHFILPRWTKDIGRILCESPIGRENPSATTLPDFQLKVTFDRLCQISGHSDEIFELVQKGMERLYVIAKARSDLIDNDFVGSSMPVLNEVLHQCVRNLSEIRM